MRRKTFDILLAVAGLFLAVTLVAAGGLLTWAHTFIGNEVHTQLAAQQIYFPAANSKAVAAPEFAAMRPYGGQQLTTGAQAEVYADHFIANHLKAIGGGKTYAQLSAEAIAQPNNAKLAAQVNTVFKGETLRGLLLNAYAFGTMGTIAGIAAIAAFIAAAVMLILGGLGLMHARRTSPDTDILNGRAARAPDPGTTPAPGHPQQRQRPRRHTRRLIWPTRLTTAELPAKHRDAGRGPARITMQSHVKRGTRVRRSALTAWPRRRSSSACPASDRMRGALRTRRPAGT